MRVGLVQMALKFLSTSGVIPPLTPTLSLCKANVVFCDGHVESPTLKFLFEDTSDDALRRWNRDHLPHREKLPP